MLDLHLHLDGSLSVKTVRNLAKLNETNIPESDFELLKMMQISPDCKDLNEYLEKFDFSCSLLQTKEALYEAAYGLCSELKEQGLIYAEIRFAPQKHTEKGITQKEAVEAVLRGISESGFFAGLILCCMRGNDNHEQNIETVRIAKEFENKGVCALDLAGAEALFATENFADFFALAKELSVPCTIHAGEADGAKSVFDALSFGAKRIGHGVRSIEDEELINELVSRKIPLEVCVKSNIDTSVFEKTSDHPIKKLMDKGVIVTVNTDNTTVSATSLRNEYKSIIEAFSLTDEEIKTLMLNSAEAAFNSDENKVILKEKIEKGFRDFIGGLNMNVIKHYDMLIDEDNDPFRDPPELQKYMDKWDGQIFFDALNLDSKKTVLEIGIGTGRIAAKVAPCCLKLTGIDISKKAIERAKENLGNHDNITFICADFTKHAFDEKFDIIYSSLTMMHFEDKKKVISKVDKLLNKGGRFCLSIDKDQSEFIDMQTRKLKIYPDTTENIVSIISETDMTVENILETEFAFIIVSHK